MLLGIQHRGEAEQFLQNWREGLQKFGLELHPDKTRLIEFGRLAAASRKQRGERKPVTFNFLGFTHICGRARKNGKFLVLRNSIRKRLLAKLKQVKEIPTYASTPSIRGRSRMQENCTCGSMRGALSDRRPYRDSMVIEGIFGGQH